MRPFVEWLVTLETLRKGQVTLHDINKPLNGCKWYLLSGYVRLKDLKQCVCVRVGLSGKCLRTSMCVPA